MKVVDLDKVDAFFDQQEALARSHKDLVELVEVFDVAGLRTLSPWESAVLKQGASTLSRAKDLLSPDTNEPKDKTNAN